MFKTLKNLVVGICAFTLIFTFMPSQSASSVVSAYMTPTSYSTDSQTFVQSYSASVYIETQEATEGEFPIPETGRASGLWGTTETIAKRVVASSCSKGITRETMEYAMDYIGNAPVWYGTDTPWSYDNWPEGATDRFKGTDGYGVIRYEQSAIEPWAKTVYHAGSSFIDAGCGLITTANALSTLTKRWVHPMELFCVLGALDQYSDYTGQSCPNSTNGAFSCGALAAACNAAGVPTEVSDSLDYGKLDAIIAEGGVVVCVMHNMPYTREGGAHYIMLYDKQVIGGETCYLLSSTTGRERSFTGIYTRDVLEGGTPNQCLYLHVNKDLVFDNTNYVTYTEDTSQ